jgi:N-acetylglucosamine-6-sulfatase
MGYKAVRTLRHKYIHYLELEGMDELYDLKNDPYEMNNLIDNADLRATLEELKADVARLSGARR